ncbi:sensor histidine kinase [Flavisolibacter ginsenosidimutans]|uniref:histidine kinase n=1 Tax=Flavisolibacter ginsenosidimutans TaxID=661481 RepID=A0A5B8UDK3_9BACT|nr:HAMP domain-containing sensor histidine kinase [Flavisolibacter ginsenosidimutans]QEC54573.1 HAMP domain-containing histidine kinase [Flavisolibacter ginsenosidimutans]
MFQQVLNWRTLLALLAILIVSGTVWYSSYLAKKIKEDERQKVELWVEAGTYLLNPANTDMEAMRVPSLVTTHNKIPIIETTEKDSIMQWVHLDSAKVEEGWRSDDKVKDPNKNSFLLDKLDEFRSAKLRVEWTDPKDSTKRNRYYYGESQLFKEVRYYPLVQLFIVGLFIFITIQAIRTSYRSTQNGVWAGMAKETAHQLGTPVSSLEGWVEILKETHGDEDFVPEIEKDVNRLRLVSDRFGKIGSTPQLDEKNVVGQVRGMVDYVQKRAGGKVSFAVQTKDEDVRAKISAPLFDWVIENLLKNALDAMEGKGKITVAINQSPTDVTIDVTDTGKGISRQNIGKVFKPGFTTKKRGWGLGLSLSKRIIDQYHKGSLTVKHSEVGKGTTFRIVLKK